MTLVFLLVATVISCKSRNSRFDFLHSAIAINLPHVLMDTSRPEKEGLDLGVDQLRERRAVALYGQKRQIVNVCQGSLQLAVGGIGRQFFFRRHYFTENGLRYAIRHATKRPDGDNPARVGDDLSEGTAYGEYGLPGKIKRNVRSGIFDDAGHIKRLSTNEPGLGEYRLDPSLVMSLEDVAYLEVDFLSSCQRILIDPPIGKVMAVINPLGHRCTDGGKSLFCEVFRQILTRKGIPANKYFTCEGDHGHTLR